MQLRRVRWGEVMTTKQDQLFASVEMLLAGLRGLATAISSDLAEVTEHEPDKIPAIPLHGRPLMGFAQIFMVARNTERLLDEVRGLPVETEESPLSNMQTQGSA